MSDRNTSFKNAVREIDEVRYGLISIDLDIHADNVEITAIWSETERGQGHAGRAMRMLLAIADEFDVDLVGQPHWLTYDTETHEELGASAEDVELMDRLNEQRLDNEQLLAWYQRLGFELTGRQIGDDPEIIRRAHTPIPGRSEAIRHPSA